MFKLKLIFYSNVEKDLVYFSWSCSVGSVEQQEEGDQKTRERNNTLHFYLWVSLRCQLKELLKDLYYFSASYLSNSQFIVISTALFYRVQEILYLWNRNCSFKMTKKKRFIDVRRPFSIKGKKTGESKRWQPAAAAGGISSALPLTWAELRSG